MCAIVFNPTVSKIQQMYFFAQNSFASNTIRYKIQLEYILANKMKERENDIKIIILN